MSSTLRTSPADASLRDLSVLRAELDRLDDALHDLLMRRAEVVEQVASSGVKGRVPMRPGREASILRRLLARHAGRLPPAGVVRIWRELLGATTAMQRPLLIAVQGDSDCLAAAREHFGALTPLRAHDGPAEALRDVAAGTASAAVLPLPAESAAPWWTALLAEPDLHVVARLPFWSDRPEGAPTVQAFVVSAAPPDPSGQDRSLLGLALAPGTGRPEFAAALAAAGFDALPPLLAGPGEAVPALADVTGFVTGDDPRLAHVPGCRVLGAYAVPVGMAP